MSKVYLLLICLLLAPFTGCIEDSALETTEKVDETDNTEDEITYIDSTVTIQLSVFPDIGYASITDFEFNINIIEKGDTVLDLSLIHI